MDVRKEQMANVLDAQAVLRQACFECRQRRGWAAVEQGEAVVRIDDVDADRVRTTAEVQVEMAHRAIFAVTAGGYARVGAERLTSAASRSGSKSSTDSIPTDSSTRFPAGATGAPAVDACCIPAEC